ncbi:MAG: 3-deoxy-manno-octulosonate cytidylyltransferase [Cyanobacteria bacterium P01_H01_bin.74]
MTSFSQILAVIPARYESTRFPGKPLADIYGKPMIQHVWERVCAVLPTEQVIVATDDARIYSVVESFGAIAAMTKSTHESGTDRVWEVASNRPEFDWVLNVQGDEPFLPTDHIQKLCQASETASYSDADILTLVTPITDVEEWQNPNSVKAVLGQNKQALYFSRAAIPFNRNAPKQLPAQTYRHLGLYLYRRQALQTITDACPHPLEYTEKLEQLRALALGFCIQADVVENTPTGIDTPEDLHLLLNQTPSASCHSVKAK